MTTAAEYLDYAKECIEWADKAATEEERQACFSMARKWTEAALRLGGPVTKPLDESPPKNARH